MKIYGYILYLITLTLGDYITLCFYILRITFLLIFSVLHLSPSFLFYEIILKFSCCCISRTNHSRSLPCTDAAAAALVSLVSLRWCMRAIIHLPRNVYNLTSILHQSYAPYLSSSSSSLSCHCHLLNDRSLLISISYHQQLLYIQLDHYYFHHY